MLTQCPERHPTVRKFDGDRPKRKASRPTETVDCPAETKTGGLSCVGLNGLDDRVTQLARWPDYRPSPTRVPKQKCDDDTPGEEFGVHLHLENRPDAEPRGNDDDVTDVQSEPG